MRRESRGDGETPSARVCGAGRESSLYNGGEGNGNPLQYSFLEKSMDRGAWQVHTVHGVAKSRTRLSD